MTSFNTVPPGDPIGERFITPDNFGLNAFIIGFHVFYDSLGMSSEGGCLPPLYTGI